MITVERKLVNMEIILKYVFAAAIPLPRRHCIVCLAAPVAAAAEGGAARGGTESPLSRRKRGGGAPVGPQRSDAATWVA